MTSPPDRTHSWGRLSLLVAVAALVASVVLGWIQPTALPGAYRFAVFCCLEPAIGCLIFLLIFHCTGGHWGEALVPSLVAGVQLLPWTWLSIAPLLWLGRMHPAPVDASDVALKAYLSPTGLTARTLALAALFFVFRWLATPIATGALSGPRFERLPWFGPVGLIVLAFSLHVLAVDWLFTLDPGWYSTAFPLIWMAGGALMGLSLAVFGRLTTGFDPKAKGASDRPLGIDWGNLLLTCTVFWAYVSFTQFLIIWSGDTAREVTWYVRRSQGAWLCVAAALVLLNLALPFFLLLSRRIKTSLSGLRGVSILLLGSQVLYTAWLILPGMAPVSCVGELLDLTLLAAVGGLFLNRFLVGAAALRTAP